MMESPASTPARRKVSTACQRCRRQKLKCDIQRPCTLCTRAKVECLPVDTSRWKVYKQQSARATPASRRIRTLLSNSAGAMAEAETAGSGHGSCFENADSDAPASPIHEPSSNGVQHWHSSSTMSLVDGAFDFHNSVAPECPITNAIPGGQLRPAFTPTPSEVPTQNGTCVGPSTSHTPSIMAPLIRPLSLSSAEALSDLLALLPERRVASLLVDTYFDRAHWFMLIFHQDEFRNRWQELYEQIKENSADTYYDVGFISTFLMVINIGLLYTGQHRNQLLEAHGVDTADLKGRILSVIRARLLDIVGIGSLATVQTCILLGTYYLFHGSPELAWPVCGCGLRVAQALNLHRKFQSDNQKKVVDLLSLRNYSETRKRCWWAIYEIETFCSVSYGYPHGIKDDDCDVEPLDPSAKLQIAQLPASFNEPLRCETTLLCYKYFMSKLSVIIKSALAELYRIEPTFTGTSKRGASALHRLIPKVSTFDAKLQSWRAELPSELKLGSSSREGGYASLEELDEGIGASGPQFENHIYDLQSLALELAYENARILVHRPLLSYKLVKKSSKEGAGGDSDSSSPKQDPFHLSLEACRDAALKTSNILSNPIADLATITYAAAFVAIHTFTAGVTLAVLGSIEPLSQRSCEAKIGLQRLMAIQKKLTPRAPIASQGLEILRRLTKLMMDKEYSELVPPQNDPPLFSTTEVDGEKMLSSTEFLDQGNVSEGEMDFGYAEDPAISQALFGLDHAFMGYAPPPGISNSRSVGSASYWSLPENSFLAPEQTWIWGMEHFQQHR